MKLGSYTILFNKQIRICCKNYFWRVHLYQWGFSCRKQKLLSLSRYVIHGRGAFQNIGWARGMSSELDSRSESENNTEELVFQSTGYLCSQQEGRESGTSHWNCWVQRHNHDCAWGIWKPLLLQLPLHLMKMMPGYPKLSPPFTPIQLPLNTS